MGRRVGPRAGRRGWAGWAEWAGRSWRAVRDVGLDRVEDLRVAGAAAQVPDELVTDLRPAGRALALGQGVGGEDHPGSAEPALGAAKPQERLLQRVQRARLPGKGRQGDD